MDWKQIVTGVVIGSILAFSGTFYNFHGRLSKIEVQIEDVQSLLTQFVTQPGINSGVVKDPLLAAQVVPKGVNVGGQVAIEDTIPKDGTKPDKKKAEKLIKRILVKEALVNLVLNGIIRINKITLEGINESEKNPEAGYMVRASITNQSNNDVEYFIPKGQIFENKKKNSGYQNLVIVKNNRDTIKSSKTKELLVGAYCLNKSAAPPRGDLGNITIFELKDKSFSSQADLWRQIEEKLKKI